MTTSVLYISYTGLLEPLGQSQVLQYVKELAQSHRLTLLTFEKSEALDDSSKVAKLVEECRSAGVEWHALRYHNKPNMLATAYDVFMGVRKGLGLVMDAGIQVVHCRSYIAGLMGLIIKRRTAVKHLFDMRGFWPDERVDGGLWRKASFNYRLFKRIERYLLLNTDHVVSLTRSGEHEIRKFEYLQDSLPPITVIPTCTNLSLFKPAAATKSEQMGFTLGYVGSAGSWYLFNKVSRVVKLLFDGNPYSSFLVISKDGHREIRNQLLAEGVDMERVELKAVEFNNVAMEISRMDAGIFFIKPTWSKRASCPTRMGEFLAMGKPCIANAMVGDVAEDLRETSTGVAVDNMIDETLTRAIAELVELSTDVHISERCRQAAKDRFALDVGVDKYSAIYSSLCE